MAFRSTLLNPRVGGAVAGIRERRTIPGVRRVLLFGALAVSLGGLLVLRPWEYREAATPPDFLVPRLVEAALGPARTPEQHLAMSRMLAEHRHRLAALEHLRAARRGGLGTVPVLKREATLLEALERHEEAEAVYQQLLRHGEDPDPLLRLAILSVRVDRPEAARRWLRRLEKSVPSGDARRPAVLREAVIAYTTLGDADRALALAREYQALRPEDPGGAVAVARAALSLGKAEVARRAAERAVELAPGEGAVRMLRAQARFAACGHRYRPEVVSDLQQAARLDPMLGRTHYHLARYYAERGLWKDAAGEYLKAYHLGTEPVRALRGVAESCTRAGMRLEGLFRMGQYYELVGRVDDALEQFRRIWKSQPCCASGYAHHSDALRRAGRTAEALRVTENGLRQVPGALPLLRRRAELLILLDRLDEARPALEKLVELDAERRASTYRNLAAVAEAKAEYDRAEAYYQQSLAADPGSADTHLRLGRLYFQRRTQGERLRLAEREYRWVVEHSPETDEAFAALATVYAEMGRARDAADLLRHAIDIAPGRGRYYLQLGQTARRAAQAETSAWALGEYRKYQRYERELRSLRTRVRARPGDPAVRLAYGRFLLNAGDYGAASDELQAAVAMSPADRQARLALALAYEGLGRHEDAMEQRMVSQRGSEPQGAQRR